jgi:hypothetical protein
MQKIPVQFDGSVTDHLPAIFDFSNKNANQFYDFEVVEIIPLNADGKQICASEFRNVILSKKGENGELSWFEAFIKTERRNDEMFNFLEAVRLATEIFSHDFDNVQINIGYHEKVFTILCDKQREPFLVELSFDEIFKWSESDELAQNLEREKNRLLNI